MRVNHLISLSLTAFFLLSCGQELKNPLEAIKHTQPDTTNLPETAAGIVTDYGDDYSIAVVGPGSAVINVVEVGAVQDDIQYLQELLIRAEAARIEARARARRDHAIADVIRAQLVDAERQIASIRHRLAQHDRIKVRIATRGRTLENIWRGDARPVVLSAMEYFFAQAGVSQAELMRSEVAPIASENFDPRGSASAPNFEGGNVIHFLEFLRRNRLNVVVGGPAHLELANLYDLISSTAAEQIANHEAAQDQIRQQRDHLWGPLERFVASINDDSIAGQ